MFDLFLSRYKADNFCKKMVISLYQPTVQSEALEEFFKLFSGNSFNNGLYRVHSAERIDFWNNLVGEAFPEFKNRIYCFGYDWLGRQFALDFERLLSSEPLVLMLEPGTGEVLEIPATLLQFHQDEIVNFADAALAADFFTTWLSAGNNPPSYDQCISYRIPLYLGGTDTVNNLEPIDLEVYWGLSVQLLDKVRGLPLGTPIGNLSID